MFKSDSAMSHDVYTSMPKRNGDGIRSVCNILLILFEVNSVHCVHEFVTIDAQSTGTMSFFSKVFGGKKEPAPLSTAEAIQKLRETEDMLIKKQEFLETKISLEIQIAKKNGTKNKRAAIQALKRKKRYEKQLQQIDGSLSTIEMQREALESANTNTAVLTTMKNAADALKSVHQHMDVDQVHDMMDDIAEQQDVAREISDAISNPVAFGQDIDEDELEKELEELEQEQLDKELLGIEPTDELPNIPATAIPTAPARTKAKPEEDEDLKELEAWAS